MLLYYRRGAYTSDIIVISTKGRGYTPVFVTILKINIVTCAECFNFNVLTMRSTQRDGLGY